MKDVLIIISVCFLLVNTQILLAQKVNEEKINPNLSPPQLSVESFDKRKEFDLSLNQKLLKSGEVPQGLSNCEWASIQHQITMGQYKAFGKEEGGFESANLKNGLQISFQSDGTTKFIPRNPSQTNYHFSFRLTGIGYEELIAFNSPLSVNSAEKEAISGSRVSYLWSEHLTEWWVNNQNKLEQWFYLREPPRGKEVGIPLRLQLAINTDMAVVQNGNKLQFTKGNTNIVYDKFKVWDANGIELTANMAWNGQRLDLVIEEENAAYPILIDPSLAQQAYIKRASAAGTAVNFGYSMDISGETLVVGAYLEDSNASGINGNQTNTLSTNSGAVYVFVRSGNTWVQQAYLKAENPDANDLFGEAVAISGETIVVGAIQEGSNSTGVNGNSADNSSPGSGAAYVFVRNGTTWTQQAYLKASNAEANDKFGEVVSISGETIVVTATWENSNATGVNGDETDNSFGDSGAAYVFVRSGTIWTQQAYLKASNTETGDNFGWSADIFGETIVVATWGEDSNATGVNGDETDNSMNRAGAAYVFIRNGTTWTQQAYLKASNTEAEDLFGYSVAISGETILVGATQEASSATGVNGDETDNTVSNAGAAYVFVRNGTIWTQQAYLKASNTGENDRFSWSADVFGETIVVGAQTESSNAIGVDGDGTDNSSLFSGAAYVFERSGTVWTQQAYLKASNTDPNDRFGGSVGITDDAIIVGAYREASSATGVNGDETDNSSSSGAVYVFESFADLSLSAVPLTQMSNEGEYQTYVCTLNNAGPETATGVKIRVTIPDNRSFISAMPSVGSYDPQSEIWEVGTAAIGNETLTLVLKMN